MATAPTGQARLTVNVQDLLEAGLHFGHQTKRWNPKMKRYIFGAHNGIYIIDLEKTLPLLLQAQQFIYDTIARGRQVLLVATKRQAQEAVKAVATRFKQPCVVTRWLGGTLTNNQTIRRSVARMRELEKMETDGTMNSLPKKEVSRLRRELQKMQYNLSGIADMDKLPGALFVLDVNCEANAVAEANRLKIPVVAVVDTNCDPDPVDYPIPGNEDGQRAIKMMMDIIGQTIEQAQAEYSRLAAEETRRRAAVEAKAKVEEEERKAKDRAARKAKTEAEAKDKAEKVEKAKKTEKAEKDAKEAGEKKTKEAGERKAVKKSVKAEAEPVPTPEAPAADAPKA
ncbi:MAG: 30S ribosomal protein S2 [Kiritimatiellaeota bacterium]|nr:30S ribosomal protein S2 [Kiritimatiellota bacterium]